MRKAIDETERRRAKQTAFNLANGIVPTAIVKRVKDLIDGVYSDKSQQQSPRGGPRRRWAQAAAALSEVELAKEIKRVEKRCSNRPNAWNSNLPPACATSWPS